MYLKIELPLISVGVVWGKKWKWSQKEKKNEPQMKEKS